MQYTNAELILIYACIKAGINTKWIDEDEFEIRLGYNREDYRNFLNDLHHGMTEFSDLHHWAFAAMLVELCMEAKFTEAEWNNWIPVNLATIQRLMDKCCGLRKIISS